LHSEGKAVLRIVSGTQRGREFDVVDGLSVGRDPSNTIHLLDSKSSRRHAVITIEHGDIVLVDQGSRNGTWLNDRAVTRATLSDGDKIYVGDTVMQLSHIVELGKTGANSIVGGRTGGLTLVLKSEEDDQCEESIANAEGFDASRQDILSGQDADDLVELKVRNEKLRRVYEVNKALSSLMSLTELLDKILEILFEILPAERGVVLLNEPDAGFKPVAGRTRHGGATELEVPVSRTLLGKVIDERVGLLSGDLMSDSRLDPSESIVIQGITSTLTVPMILRDSVVGIVHLDTVGSYAAFNKEDLEIVTGVASQAAVAVENARLLEKVEEQAVIRTNLSRYLSAELVDRVLTHDADFSMEGESKKATILFADIRGFTAMSERIPPHMVVRMLNDYFEIMVDIIISRGGVVDKFVGDEIMAVWGVPEARDDDALQAVNAAIRMQQALCSYNERRLAIKEEPVFMGIGIASGVVVAGNLGCSKRMQYTVIGDTVNLASRIEGLTEKEQILIGKYTHELVKDDIKALELEPVQVKGKQGKISIYEVRGLVDRVNPDLGRKFQRVKTALPIRCLRVSSDRLFPGVLLDISPGGGGVRCRLSEVEDVEKGERLVVGFTDAEGAKVLIKGDVVRIANEEGRQQGLCVVGLAFAETPSYVEEVIEKVIVAGSNA